MYQKFIPTPAGSPPRSGDVVVYVKDVNQPSLPTPFYSVLVSVSVSMALSTVFHSINSPNNCPLSHSLLLVLFLPYWWVPTGSPSRGGDVIVYVKDIKQPSLPTPFHSVPVSVSVFMALSAVFYSTNSPRQLSFFSLCSSDLLGPFNCVSFYDMLMPLLLIIIRSIITSSSSRSP